jgi:hypothetical protein
MAIPMKRIIPAAVQSPENPGMGDNPRGMKNLKNSSGIALRL